MRVVHLAIAFAMMTGCGQPKTPAPGSPGIVHVTWVIHSTKGGATSFEVRVDGNASAHFSASQGEWHVATCESHGPTRGYRISPTEGIGYDLETRTDGAKGARVDVVYHDDNFPFYSTCGDEEGHSMSCPPVRSVVATFAIPVGATIRESARIDDGPEVDVVPCPP